VSNPTGPPEIPYPFPPRREPPRRHDPVAVPMVDVGPDDPRSRLFERRTVLVGGPLDAGAVTRLAAELMALDGRGDGAVELMVNSPGGPMEEVTAVLDVMDLMRGRVNATCTGVAHGTAGVLLACATGRRRAGRHAVVSLRLPAVEAVGRSADALASRAAQAAAVRQVLVVAVAQATGMGPDDVAAAFDHGGPLDAVAAKDLGLVDEVVDAGPGLQR
jgi:ATP-dependent Clp protease protease subunit